MNVSGPNGVQNISNPLFSFTFKPFNGSIFPDFPVSPLHQLQSQIHKANSSLSTINGMKRSGLLIPLATPTLSRITRL
jgi:tyrosinase